MSAAGRGRRLRGFVLASLAAVLSACALPPSGAESLTLDSRDYRFLDGILQARAAPAQRVDAQLYFPAVVEASTPLPAVVMLHSSVGQGTQDWEYTRRLRELGLIVLAVDSFSARGVRKTVKDQTLVSAAAMLADAYAALAFLRADPRVDGDRVALLGFSKGGVAALYAAYERVRARLAEDGARFALHVAYYPWCGLRLRDPRTTGAPVLIHTGALDEVAPADLCRELIAETVAGGGTPMRHEVYRGARHAFDHPLLAYFGRLPVGGPVPSDCLFREGANGGFVEESSGRAVTSETLKEVLDACSAKGATAGGSEEADAAAFARTARLMRRILGPLGEGAPDG